MSLIENGDKSVYESSAGQLCKTLTKSIKQNMLAALHSDGE